MSRSRWLGEFHYAAEDGGSLLNLSAYTAYLIDIKLIIRDTVGSSRCRPLQNYLIAPHKAP
jgi:hypothetical protein